MARFGRSFPVPSRVVTRARLADPAVTVALAGAILSGAPRASAQLTTTVELGGHVKAVARAYGQVGTSVPLAGRAVVVGRAYGNAQTTVALAGRVAAISRLYGNADTTVALAGRALAISRLRGTLSTAAMVELAGQIRASGRLYGNLVTTVALSGKSVALSRLSGQLQTTVQLAGQLQAISRLYGDAIAAGSIALSGQVQAVGRAYGQLQTSIPLSGYVLAIARLRGQTDVLASTDPYDNTLIDSQAEIESPKALIPAGISTTIRPGALTFDYLLAYSLGPVAIGSASEGILGHAWYVRADTGVVNYARSNDAYDDWQGEAPLFSFSGADIIELDCAFEQNGRIVVAAERATGSGGSSEIWIYWYKPSAAAFVFENFGAGRTPRVVLDNPNDTAISDVHVAYIKDGTGLATRRQSELYATENGTNFTDSTDWYLEEFARNRGNRLVAVLSRRIGDRWYLDRVESTLYPFYPDDTASFGGSVLDTSEMFTTLLLHTLYDKDTFDLAADVLNTSTLADVVLVTASQDDSEADFTADVLATSDLAVVLIVSAAQDDSEADFTADVLNTSTLVVVVITDLTDEDEDVFDFTASVLATSTLEVP